MNKILSNSVILSVIFLISSFAVFSQGVKPAKVSKAIYHDVIGPIRDFPALTEEELAAEQFEPKVERNEELRERLYPFAETALPKGPDALWQKEMGTTSLGSGREIFNVFDGQSSYSNPPDDNGTAGYDYYMQTINVKYTIYDKSGNLLAGPTNVNTLFEGVPGATRNDGDPIVMFDEQIGRFFVAEFSGIGSAPDYMLIAISQTDDPTGMWDRWSFPMTGFPDYMKFGIWRDAYYMGTNTYNGNDIYAFERDVMIAGGDSPQMVQFNNPWRPNSGFHCVLPVDNDGEFAPEGTPGMFLTINDDAWGGSPDQLWLYELAVDWTDPASSTFNRVQQLDVEPFDSNFGPTWENITQPGTSQKLDAINQILMHRVQYRNFGSSQSIVCQHTVDVDGTDHAGIRWYELTESGGNWDIRQSGTYAPDDDNRWMGSIAMNSNHEIALGYSVSSTTTYPSIRVTGQTAAEYETASGILDVQEFSIHEGNASQTSTERWGDYANMAVDPSDDLTFWFTTEYNISNQQKGTKIASFSITTVPLADFHASHTLVPTGQSIDFFDDSYGNPTEWSWSFEGGTPSESSAQNPEGIVYNQEGTFDVQLIATNPNGTNTLLKEGYITVSSTILPDVKFEVDKNSLCMNDTAVFTDLTDNIPIAWDWQFSPATVTFVNGTSSESQNPEVVFDEPGMYSVTLTATNMNGSNSLTHNDMVLAGGYVPDFLETFEENGLSDHNWTIENPDDDKTWELFEIGGTTPGNMAIGLDFSDYLAIGERDRLISPPFNLSGLSTASLSFEHAYAKKHEDATDSLIIYISTDCGATWTRIFEGGDDGSGNFATHEMTDDFWPEVESDWCLSGYGASCIDIDVSQYAGNTDVRFAFETYSFYGNPIFLDNIVVSQTVGLNENLNTTDELKVYPNPAQSTFTIVLPDNTSLTEIQITDYTSKVVYRQSIPADQKSIIISAERWASGVYIIRASGNNNIFAKKVVKY